MDKEAIYKAFFDQIRKKLNDKLIKNPGDMITEIRELVRFVERLEDMK